jgi:hypothetical protein
LFPRQLCSGADWISFRELAKIWVGVREYLERFILGRVINI